MPEQVLISIAITLITSALQSLLAPSPQKPFGGNREREINPLQPIPPRTVVYGFVRVGGPFGFIETTNDNKEMHAVYLHAAHEVTEFSQLILDSVPWRIGGDGQSLDKKTGGLASPGNVFARVKTHVGTDTQVADPDLVAEVEKWTSDHRLQGVAYSYVRWIGNQLPDGRIPTVSWYIKGKKVFDPRDSQTKFTINPALMLRDYLTDTKLGLGLSTSRIIDSDVIAAANICEELVAVKQQSDDITVEDLTDNILARTTRNARWFYGDVVQVSSTGTLPAGLSPSTDYFIIPVGFTPRNEDVDEDPDQSTFKLATTFENAMAGVAIDITDAGTGIHTATRTKEPRYTASGIIDTDEDPANVVRKLLSTMSGKLTRTGSEIVIKAGAWEVPDVTFTDKDVVDPIQIQSRQERQQIANGVKGTFADPYELFEPTDFPAITDAGATAEDGGNRIWKDVDLTMTPSPSIAQRISKIDLGKIRRQKSLRTRFKMIGLKTRGGDNVIFDDPDLGLSNQSFEVTEWILAMERGAENAPLLSSVMSLRELDASVFDFLSEEEIEKPLVIPASGVNLSIVAPPTIDAILSGTDQLFLKGDGTVVSRIKIEWTNNDGFAKQTEIQFKKTGEINWEPLSLFDEEAIEAFIFDVEDGSDYQVRIRTINSVGAKSDFVVSATHTVIGKTQPPSDVTGFVVEAARDRLNFMWDVVPDIDVNEYEIRRGAFWDTAVFEARVNSLQHQTPQGTGINDTYLIKAIDTSGNESVNAKSVVLSVMLPTVFDLIPQVIDNNVLLRWSFTTGTFDLARFEIRKGNDFDTAEVIGTSDTTFSIIQELFAGEFTYWVAPVDTVGNIGSSDNITVTVDEPPDFVFRNQFETDWIGNSRTNIRQLRLRGGDTDRPLRSALKFDGVDDLVNVGDVLDQTDSFTVEAWIEPEDIDTPGQRIVAKDDGVDGWGLSLGDPGSGAIRFFHRELSNVNTDTPTGVIIKNKKHHVRAVFNASASMVTIYVDGVQQAQTTG